MQALQQGVSKENKALITRVKNLLLQHKQSNRQVTLNWIPSHIGIAGNEEADQLAKQTRFVDQVQVPVQPSLSQLCNRAKSQARARMQEKANFHIQQGSYSADWYKMVTDHNTYPMGQVQRQLATTIHRLRLGYKANWEIVNPEPRECKHCDTLTEMPLLHYLLQCHTTRTLRMHADIPEDITSRQAMQVAAKIAKEATENIEQFGHLLMSYPPPR